MRIPLPTFVQVGTKKGHPYPFGVAIQTIEIIQASVFYAMLGDLAAGAYFRDVGTSRTIDQELLEQGLFPEGSDEGWKLFAKYSGLLKLSVFQNVLVSMRSNWDWYVRSLRDFIDHSRSSVASPVLSGTLAKKLQRIDRCSLLDQLRVLEAATGTQFEIQPADRGLLREMSLVRNLGLHHRWEVDHQYLASSSVGKFGLGEVRLFDAEELTAWYSALLRAIRETAKRVSIKYVNAPDYPTV